MIWISIYYQDYYSFIFNILIDGKQFSFKMINIELLLSHKLIKFYWLINWINLKNIKNNIKLIGSLKLFSFPTNKIWWKNFPNIIFYTRFQSNLKLNSKSENTK